MVKRTVRRRLRGGDDPVAPAAPGGILGFFKGVGDRVASVASAAKERVFGAPATETPAAAPASSPDGVPAGGRRRKTTRLSRRQRRTRRHARRH